MAKWKGFCGPSYTPASKIAAYDESVNLFCERIESGTGNDGAQYTMYQAPGYQELLTLGSTPGRGAASNGDQGYFVVAGPTFFLADASFGAVSNLTDRPAYIVVGTTEGHQVLVASDNATYSFDTVSHVFTNVGSQTSVSYPTTIGFLGTYGLRLDPALSQVGFSAPNDFTTWNALDVFRREDRPDRWMRLLVVGKEVWLFGEYTTSIYYLSDSATTPFRPIPSVSVEAGIMAIDSACVVDGSAMWVGQSADGWGIVYLSEGYTPRRVSTHGIEDTLRALSRSGRLQYGEGSTYQENGHVFYLLTFPSDGDNLGITLVYDATEGLWHKRGDYNGLQYVELDTRAQFTNTGGDDVMLTLSRTSGKIYMQSSSYYTNTAGTGIRWMRRAPHMSDENKGCIIDSVELKFQPGTANANGLGSDPHFTLSFSRNGGQTWSNAQTVSAGLTGECDTRAIWEQLGYGRDRLIEIVGSDACFTPIIDAYVNARTGRN